MNIGIWAPLGPFGTLGPYLFSYLGPLWALLGPLDPIMSDFYETLLFWGMQEAFWKGRKLSGKTRMILKIQNGSGVSPGQ